MRLDVELVNRGIVATRSQAENYIKLGYVTVKGKVITKPGAITDEKSDIRLNINEQYVSRAALKLDSVAGKFKLDFKNKVVLDVGSSTGGFTDYALRHNARKIVAVDVGSEQLHSLLRGDERVELHEKTDIRGFQLESTPDIIMADLSFISLRLVLPHLVEIAVPKTQLVVLLKPQFEAGREQINRGIIKNDRMRRQIMKDFENWVQKLFIIDNKADSQIAGSKGNQERFYLLRIAG